MKNIKYILVAFIALFIFTSPTYALKISTDKSIIPYTEEELNTYIEAIKSSTQFTTEMQNYNTYMIAFQKSGSTNIFNSAETTNVLTFCFRNDTFQFSDPTSALLCESNRYIYFPLNNGITTRSQKTFNVNYLNYLIESNMNITYFEDITDINGNVLYSTGENIFNTKTEITHEKIVLEEQPIGSWIPFLLPKSQFDKLITENYNLDPNTELMVALYIVINIIIFYIFIKYTIRTLRGILKLIGV